MATYFDSHAIVSITFKLDEDEPTIRCDTMSIQNTNRNIKGLKGRPKLQTQ